MSDSVFTEKLIFTCSRAKLQSRLACALIHMFVFKMFFNSKGEVCGSRHTLTIITTNFSYDSLCFNVVT